MKTWRLKFRIEIPNISYTSFLLNFKLSSLVIGDSSLGKRKVSLGRTYSKKAYSRGRRFNLLWRLPCDSLGGKRLSPQLEVGKLVDRSKMIEDRLKKNDFRTARFLLDDLKPKSFSLRRT